MLLDMIWTGRRYDKRSSVEITFIQKRVSEILMKSTVK